MLISFIKCKTQEITAYAGICAWGDRVSGRNPIINAP